MKLTHLKMIVECFYIISISLPSPYCFMMKMVTDYVTFIINLGWNDHFKRPQVIGKFSWKWNQYLTIFVWKFWWELVGGEIITFDLMSRVIARTTPFDFFVMNTKLTVLVKKIKKLKDCKSKSSFEEHLTSTSKVSSEGWPLDHLTSDHQIEPHEWQLFLFL